MLANVTAAVSATNVSPSPLPVAAQKMKEVAQLFIQTLSCTEVPSVWNQVPFLPNDTKGRLEKLFTADVIAMLKSRSFPADSNFFIFSQGQVEDKDKKDGGVYTTEGFENLLKFLQTDRRIVAWGLSSAGDNLRYIVCF